MRKILVFLIAACLLLRIVTGQEEGADWQVVLLDITGQQIVYVTSDGLSDQNTPIPEGLYDAAIGMPFFELSPDERYLAYAVRGPDSAVQLRLADLTSDSCCTVIEPPFDNVDFISIGPFNPDGNRLVAAFSRIYGENWQQRLMILDAATGATISSVDPMSLLNSNNVYFGTWTAEGIEVYQTCFACDGVWNGIFSVWNPEDNSLTPSTHYFSMIGDRLAETGEFVEAVQHPDYPILAMPSLRPLPNVIAYYSDGYPPDGLPLVIFAGTPYYEAGQYVSRPMWVANGAAIFIPSMANVPAHLIFRDGASDTVETITDNMIFLTGTPDGWLMFNRNDFSLILYSMDAERRVSSQVIAQFQGFVQVLQAPMLGAGIEPDFAIIE